MELYLWSDGSPYVRESDMLNSGEVGLSAGKIYDVYVLPELPPFLIYSGASFEAAKKPEIYNRQFEAVFANAYLEAYGNGEVPEPLYIDDLFAAQLIQGIESIGAESVVFNH